MSQDPSTQPTDNKQLNIKLGIYLLPNLFTTAALFSGFYSIVASFKGLYSLAAISIFIAMILDSLDGRVARLTNTQSEFGAEYDSLSDMVAFGLAPALLAYSWGLSLLGKIGWLAAFVYAAAAALRLAKFNIQVVAEKRYFFGLPSPSAAAIVTSMIWVAQDIFAPSYFLAIIVSLVTISAGVLMVSNVKYRSFKDIDFKGKMPFASILFVIVIFVLVAVDPPYVLFMAFLLYVVSGPVFYLRRYFKMRCNKNVTNTQEH